VFSYLLMAAIQEISARIGRVTGFGIAGNLRRHYPAWLSHPAWLSGGTVLLLLSSNLINLGADLGAMGAALKLLIGGPALLYVVLFRRALGRVADLHALCTASSPSSNGGACRCSSYVICASVLHVAWGEVAWAVVWPPLSSKAEYLMALVDFSGRPGRSDDQMNLMLAGQTASGPSAQARYIRSTSNGAACRARSRSKDRGTPENAAARPAGRISVPKPLRHCRQRALVQPARGWNRGLAG
jgi:hypothetical protein